MSTCTLSHWQEINNQPSVDEPENVGFHSSPIGPTSPLFLTRYSSCCYGCCSTTLHSTTYTSMRLPCLNHATSLLLVCIIGCTSWLGLVESFAPHLSASPSACRALLSPSLIRTTTIVVRRVGATADDATKTFEAASSFPELGVDGVYHILNEEQHK